MVVSLLDFHRRIKVLKISTVALKNEITTLSKLLSLSDNILLVNMAITIYHDVNVRDMVSNNYIMSLLLFVRVIISDNSI